MSSLLGICLALAVSAQADLPRASVFVPGERFTLAWTHSIEKVRWEEDYLVKASPDPAMPPLLLAVKARVRGSAAGMEPPDDSVLRNGWYEYTPQIAEVAELRLTRSEFTADYEICTVTGCQPISHWLPTDNAITLLTPCRSSELHPAGRTTKMSVAAPASAAAAKYWWTSRVCLAYGHPGFGASHTLQACSQ